MAKTYKEELKILQRETETKKHTKQIQTSQLYPNVIISGDTTQTTFEYEEYPKMVTDGQINGQHKKSQCKKDEQT